VPKRRRKKGEQRQGVCVYCGAQGPITDDHVFPKVIFLVLDEQMITVPACSDCQHTKGLGDRDLRTFIIMDIGGSQHPDAIDMAARMLKESNVRLRNWIQRQLESTREVDLITDSGVIVGKAIEFDFNTERIMMAQQMVVRGIYYHEKGAILPPDCPIEIQHIPWNLAFKFIDGILTRTTIKPKFKGRDVAAWSPIPVDGFPADSSAWLVWYNDFVLFFGATGELAQRIRERRLTSQSGNEDGSEVVNVGPRRVVVPRGLDGQPMIPPQ
jgi:hypothetical protein